MARIPKFNVTKAKSGWMVNVPASTTASGKRERHFRTTRDAAKKHAVKLRAEYAENGSNASSISPSLAEDATRATSILEPYGISLTEAAHRVVREIERLKASKTIEDAGLAWEQSWDGLRERSVTSYRGTLEKLKKQMPGRVMATISAEEISEAIKTVGVAGATNSLQRRNARAFWNWCAKKGWCDKGEFEKVDTYRHVEDKEISFFSVEEATQLLRTAEEHYPKAVPMYAVAMFAGVRAEELKRLEGQHVTEDGIELSADVTKRRRRRYIQMNDTLSEWLRVYPFEKCPNWRKVDSAVRRLAGWDVSSELLSDPGRPHRGKWPQNALRHTHATYAISSGVPLVTMLFEFGHAGGIETLKKHYLGRATKNQAKEFYELVPMKKLM